MIRVILNGEERELEPGLTVTTLLDHLGLHPRLVVVEHNRHILDRTAFDATEVRAGDSFELVHFVGGG
jgi:sulfur carrier protein